MTAILGCDRVGEGPRAILVLNDWMSDTSTWDSARAYLDRERFTWVFADLRGYGRSRELRGAYDASEGTTDVLQLADTLKIRRFVIVGHSMSTLVALHLAQHHDDRIERAVLITPPPPAGFGAPPEVMDGAQALARTDGATRAQLLAARFGDRLSPAWTRLKAQRFHDTCTPEAAATYVSMFMRDGAPTPTARVKVPVLAITGEQDSPLMRRAAVEENFGRICDRLTVVALADSGHYPMQEMPPLTVALIEKFANE